MANSRLEKIGTIYSRTRGLLQSGALKWADRPLWYDVYEAYPPNEEPRFNRLAPNIPLRQIFYEEDNIRALLHKKFKNVGTINLSNDKKSFTQRFVNVYKKLEMQYAGGATQEKIFDEALEMLMREKEMQKEMTEDSTDPTSLTVQFKNAQQMQSKDNANIKVNVKDIFKE